MPTVKEKRGWKRLTGSNLDECGLCDNVLLGARTGIVMEAEDKGRHCHFGVDLCDDCRRLVCTCDSCSAFNREVVELPEEEEEADEDAREVPQFEFYCQKTADMEETEEEDWCLQWTQARVLTSEQIQWRLDGRPGEDEEE